MVARRIRRGSVIVREQDRERGGERKSYKSRWRSAVRFTFNRVVGVESETIY